MKKCLLLLLTSFLSAQTYSVVIDNDALIDEDQHYTNGIKYIWMSDNNIDFPDILNFIDLEQKNVAFSITHRIFTPKDKDRSTRDLNDLPYAGTLNLNFLMYKSSANIFHELGINAGMIGPSAHADTLQKSFHSLIGHDKPNGWDTQLNDQFIAGISYNIGYKTDPINVNTLNLDFTVNAKADLGNFYSGGLIGSTARISRFPLNNFQSITNGIGTNESLLLNYKTNANFNWALSLGLYYNIIDTYYIVDEAIDEGYNLTQIDEMFGGEVSLDLYFESLKISVYLKASNSNPKEDSLFKVHEKTGGMSVIWQY